jgi:hypothetical protein
LETSGGNLSILGFYAEQMVISSLAIKGHELVVLGPNFQNMGMVGKKKRAQPWKIRTFMRQIPHLSRETGVTMYIPTEYNNKAVDAIVNSISEDMAQRVWQHFFPV